MDRNLVVTLVAVALVGAGAFLFGRNSASEAPARGGSPELPSRSDAGAPDRITVADREATRQRLGRPLVPDAVGSAAPPPPVPPLPPHDVPLAQVRDELEQRARSGDRRAACRLAVDLIRCQELPTVRAASSAMERSLARDDVARDEPNVGFRIDFLARTQNRLEALEPLCAGIDPLDAAQGFDWLLRAAELGHAPSMAEFARRPAVPFQSYLSELDRLRVYRERAPEMAMRAIAAGDVSLLPELASAHLDNPGHMGFSPLSQLVEKDNATAYAYYALMQRFTPLPPTPTAPSSAAAPVPPQPIRGRREMGMGMGRGGGGTDPTRLARVFEAVSPEDRARGEALAGEWESRYFERHRAPTPAEGAGRGTATPGMCDSS